VAARFARRAQIEPMKEDLTMASAAETVKQKTVPLKGRIFVADPTGRKPLEGVEVEARDFEDHVLGQGRTDAKGEFEFAVPATVLQVRLVLKATATAAPVVPDVLVFPGEDKIYELPFRDVPSSSGAKVSDQPAKTEPNGGADAGVATPNATTANQAAKSDVAKTKPKREPVPTETHKIKGNVTGAGGSPLAGVIISVRDSTGKLLGEATTDQNGSYEYSVGAAGNYSVYVLGKRGRPIMSRNIRVNSVVSANFALTPAAAGRALRRQRFGPGGDPTAYPVLTEEVGWPPSPLATPSGSAAAAPSGAPLGLTAAKALSDVLGWKLKTDDPSGFVGALTQSFQLTDVEGHVESRWKPRTYAVQTDLGGGITGAQASLCSRAKDALDQSLPLLDGLYPLDPEADQEDVKALRELARNQMTQLVQEFGAVGGPSVSRVNTYFTMLLGTATKPPTDADGLTDGTLNSIKDVYGLKFEDNPFSNSIEDEQDITNFRIIFDYTISLLQTWINNQRFFLGTPGQPAFLGTQLVLISRQLSVVAETVNEVRFVLDSVFIGPAERQTLGITLIDGSDSIIFLEDILVKIENFVGDEAPRLLRDGGRLAVTTNVVPVAEMLQMFVESAKQQIIGVPDGYQTVRVQNSLDDLGDQIDELLTLAGAIGRTLPPPEPVPQAGPLNVARVNPNAANGITGPVIVSVLGTGFRNPANAQNPATCAFTQNTDSGAASIAVLSAQVVSSTLLLAQLDIDPQQPTGAYDVTVTNPDGKSATQSGAFGV
jgi:hypothetical protein